jgi:hypothetical protein
MVGCGGRSSVNVGGSCTIDESCTTGVCLPETRHNAQAVWQGGYCSGNCEKRACPTGSCLRFEDGLSYCVSSCQDNQGCRTGYVCATSVGACLPDCRLGWPCGSALICNAQTGTCDPPPVTPAPIGGPCTWNVECVSGLCTPELGTSGPTYWSGGSCTQDCSATACPAGSNCVTFTTGDALCVDACAASGECRTGYVCATSVGACLPDCRLGWPCGSALACNAKTGTCDPPPVIQEPIGAPCTWNVECISGLCTPELGASGPTYWTGGSCTQDCSATACPAGSNCVTFTTSDALCVDACAASGECRTGYVCATSVGACLPDCRLGWPCGSALACNAKTGTCDPPPVIQEPIGAPCTWNVECISGLCTPELGASGPTYWSGGSCTQDCSAAACPDGSNCVTFTTGDALCVDACAASGECRTGYVCATSVGACLPDCRLGWPCGSALACNAQTGTCDPPPVTPAPIGAPCTWNVECVSGLCTPEQGVSGPTYWTGGSCTQDCSATACPAGSNCVTFSTGDAFCVEACAATAECRSGYVCDPDVLACLPDCRLGWSCGTYFICDGQTGMCVTPPGSTTDGGVDAGRSPDAWRADSTAGPPDDVGAGPGGPGGNDDARGSGAGGGSGGPGSGPGAGI